MHLPVHRILMICAVLLLTILGSAGQLPVAANQGSNWDNETDVYVDRTAPGLFSPVEMTALRPNTPPIIVEGGSASLNICQGSALYIPLQAIDDNVDVLTWSILISPSHGMAAPSPVRGEKTTVEYKPLSFYTGLDQFAVQVMDDRGVTDTISVSISVGCSNPPEIIGPDPINISTCQGRAFRFTLHASDDDGDSLTWSILKEPSHGSAIPSPTTGYITSVEYNPEFSYYGPDEFSVLVSDTGGRVDSVKANVTVKPSKDCLAFVYLPSVCKLAPACFEGSWEQALNNSYDFASGPLCFNREYWGFPDDPKDYFYFDLSEIAAIHVELNNYTGGGGQILIFYQTVSTRVGWDYDPPYVIDLADAKPGRYYIFIYTESGWNTITPYSLRVNR